MFKVNLSLNKSVLCYNRGIITLIPKQGKDPLLPISSRPITLLNYDYSLVSKLVKNKMKRFLQTLTRSDWSDFVRRHYIDDKIRMLFDIVSVTNGINDVCLTRPYNAFTSGFQIILYFQL